MTTRKGTSQSKKTEPVMKRPFSRSRSIDELLGDTAVGEPSDLGQAFLHAADVKSEAATQPAVAAKGLSHAVQGAKQPSASENNSNRDGVLISIELVVENLKLQPRLRIDEEHVISLSEKFSQHGQLNAILVRPTDVDGELRYEIIGGNHRFRAAKRLGWKEIRCNIRAVSFEEARILAVDDNDSNLPTTDYEKALAYHSLLEDNIVSSQGELGELFGLSRPRVNQCLSFMALPVSVREILNDHPSLFSYRTAVELKKVLANHSNEQGETPQEVVEHVTAGVSRLIDGAPLSGLFHWIEQRIAGKAPFKSTVEPRIVLDKAGRTAFKTKTKANSVVVEWDKKMDFSEDDVQEALMVALRTLAEKQGIDVDE